MNGAVPAGVPPRGRAELDAELARLAARLAGGARAVFAADYDGTLAPIAPRPEAAALPDRTALLLAELAASPGLTVAVISGRSLDDLAAMVAVAGVHLFGSAGAERRRADGGTAGLLHTPHATALVREMLARLAGLPVVHPGAWAESKPLGVTVHYRGVAPASADLVPEEVARRLAGLAGVRSLPGPMAVELTVDTGRTKATALRELLAEAALPVGESPPAVIPVFAGDAANDADAMDEARRLGGIAIGVGPDAPAEGHFRLSGPAELAEVLEAWLPMLPGRPGPRRG